MDKKLEKARRKALEVSVLIANMSKVSDIIAPVEDLIEILTSEKVFTGVEMRDLEISEPSIENIILNTLRKNGALTLVKLCKFSKLESKKVKKVMPRMILSGQIKSIQRQSSWRRFAVAD